MQFLYKVYFHLFIKLNKEMKNWFNGRVVFVP
jgi:hypothetical protein